MPVWTPERVKRTAGRKARKYGLNPRIFKRQIGAESNFDVDAVSPAGARGPAQIMPATARAWGVNPDKPRQALDAAAKNMADYVREYGSYEAALRAYNAGPGAIEASKGYAETNAYVAKILRGEDPRKLNRPGTRNGGGRAPVFRPGTPDRLEVGRQTTFDQEGYEQAQRRAFLGERLGVDRNSILFKSGLLGGTPSPEDFTSSKLTSKIVRGKDSEVVDAGAGGGGGLPSGQVGAAVSAARKRLGVQEVGTSNTGAKVNKWERQYGMVGQPWCGIFTGIVLKNAGVKGWNDPSMPSVAGIEARARSGAGPFRGWASPNRAEAGDLLVTAKGQHVAFIEKVKKNGDIVVIGGNQTGGVTRVTHKPGSVYGVAKVRYRRR